MSHLPTCLRMDAGAEKRGGGTRTGKTPGLAPSARSLTTSGA